LTYWKGDANNPARVLVNAGEYLWAVNARTGKPIANFGEGGHLRTGESRVAVAIYRSSIIVAGYVRDVFAFDITTGEPLWTFHTMPQPGEFGADTWTRTENGANCWGGAALDESRGIYFVSTGSPKPDFVGVNHQGSNLFANCLIAIDA